MGFISNQWLKEPKSRRTSYRPIRVNLSSETCSDSWSKNNDVAAKLCASTRSRRQQCDSDWTVDEKGELIQLPTKPKHERGEYVTVHFTPGDLKAIVPALVRCLDGETRRELGMRALERLDDNALLETLRELLERRHATAERTNKASKMKVPR
jgi:hypothetical protein